MKVDICRVKDFIEGLRESAKCDSVYIQLDNQTLTLRTYWHLPIFHCWQRAFSFDEIEQAKFDLLEEFGKEAREAKARLDEGKVQ